MSLSIKIFPFSGSSNPKSKSKIVVFPEPDGPTIQLIELGKKLKLIFLTAIFSLFLYV